MTLSACREFQNITSQSIYIFCHSAAKQTPSLRSSRNRLNWQPVCQLSSAISYHNYHDNVVNWFPRWQHRWTKYHKYTLKIYRLRKPFYLRLYMGDELNYCVYNGTFVQKSFSCCFELDLWKFGTKQTCLLRSSWNRPIILPTPHGNIRNSHIIIFLVAEIRQFWQTDKKVTSNLSKAHMSVMTRHSIGAPT